MFYYSGPFLLCGYESRHEMKNWLFEKRFSNLDVMIISSVSFQIVEFVMRHWK